jgi:amino acid adenylation domain-containing protein
LNFEIFIDECIEKNISFSIRDENLAISAPEGILSAGIVSDIKHYKNALIDWLHTQTRKKVSLQRPKISVINRDIGPIPLSFSQQRLWFIDQLNSGSADYTMGGALKIRGKLNPLWVEQAFQYLIQRHEPLRTVFREINDSPVQHILPEFDFKLTCLDFENDRDQESKVAEFLHSAPLLPFDLTQDLMLRSTYMRLSSDHSLLCFTLHHIASDGWSMGVLMKEFTQLYQQLSAQSAPELPPLSIQYADYAHWQRNWLQGEVLDSQVSYWMKQLDEVPPLHSLPLDKLRPQIKGQQGALVSASLPSETAQQLIKLARKFQLTPFMLLHSALALVLSRHSNSADIVIGTPVANRMQTELEPLIGCFVNTLVLRVDTAHEQLNDYLMHVKQVHLDAQSNQDVPFDLLVEKLKIPRSTAYTPLFQIMLTTDTDYNLNTAQDETTFTLPGVDISMLESNITPAKFDLDINISISDEGVFTRWTYDKSLFTQAHIEQFNTHLCHLLNGLAELDDEAIKADPVIKDLPILLDHELDYLQNTLNDTQTNYAKDKCIHELFEQQAEENPDNIALVFEGQQLTYKILNEKSNQLAHYLVENHHIKPDSLVGICVERSLEMVIGLLAILKAGGAYVPLDPTYPEARLAYMLKDAALDLVLTQTQLTIEALDLSQTLILDNLADVSGDKETHFTVYPTHNLDNSASGGTSAQLAYVIYTSGSTGQPKGVAVAHQNTHAMLDWANTQFSDEVLSKVLASTSLNFDLSVFEIFLPICFGHECIIVKNAMSLLDSDLGVTLINTVPSAIQALLASNAIPSTVKAVNLAGEPLSSDIVNDLFNTTRCEHVYNLYGPSEDTTYSTYAKFNGNIEDKPVIGRVISNSQALILNDALEILPFGSLGQLYLGGDGLARGYLNKPALTAERFIENPYYDVKNPNSSKRLYQTGDIVRYQPDGDLEFIGRIDEQVKIRGFRVELGEIEYQLEQQADLDSALVLAKDTDAGHKQLIAYVKVIPDLFPFEAQGNELIAEFIQAVKVNLRVSLPEYMVPGAFVLINEWPLTPNGKLDKNALPELDGSVLQGEYVAPETDTEKFLTSVWSDLLAIKADKISLTANFLELGGHSLKAMKLISVLNIEYQVLLSFAQIMAMGSLQNLVEYVDQNRFSEKKCAEQRVFKANTDNKQEREVFEL